MPWHRQRLAGLDVDHVSEADIESLPVMTKADMMDNFDDITADRRVTRRLCEAHLEQETGPGYLLGEYSGVRGVERPAGRVRLRLGGVGARYLRAAAA